MTGILKVISGKVKLQSYSRIQHDDDSGKILVNREIPRILDKNSPASFLTGCDSNYHEITALDGGPAAFFDVGLMKAVILGEITKSHSTGALASLQ